MRSRNNKLINFILEISQVILVFLGVYSAVMCTATSLELSFSRAVCTLVMLLAAFLFYGLFTVLETFHNGKIYGIAGITVFFAMIIFYFRSQVQKGFVLIVNGFLKGFMSYSGSKLTLLAYNPEKESASVRFCTSFVLILLGVYLIVVISGFFYRRRRSAVFLAATVPFVILPLVVGRLGYFSNLFTYLIVAMSIIGTRHLKTDATDRRMRQKLSILLMLIGLSVGGITYLFMPPSRYESHKDDITETKNSVVALMAWSGEDVFSWVKAHFNGDAIDYGEIGGKQEVDYTGETMLKISGTVNNNYGLYLKGYVGDHYENNEWSSLQKDEGYMSDLAALEQQGAAPDAWHVQLEKAIKEKSNSNMNKWAEGTLRIRNLAFGYGNYLVPYLPIVPFQSDSDGKTTIETGGIDYTVEYYLTSAAVMRRDLLAQNFSMLDDVFWYNTATQRGLMTDFAKKYYLQVPDTLTGVCDDFKKYLNDNGGKYEQFQNGIDQTEAILKLTRTYIAKNTEYTLAPGRTPSDRDTVEYFLNEGKKGYCTYYATTAAMLLRSVGIPTRYVEGMYISPEELTEGTDQNAEILVPDSDAHAWIEVYTDKYGFVPLEVTPGIGEDNFSQQGNNNSSDDQQKDSEPDKQDTPEEPPQEEPELVTPTPAVTQVPEEDMTFDDIQRDTDPNGEQGGLTGSESTSSKVIRLILEILAVLVLIVVVLEGERRIRSYLFRKSLQSLRIKRRIRMAHRHLMPLFNARGAAYKGQPVAVYAAAISEAVNMPVDQITEYVNLVYHARFGPDDITEAELAEFRMQFDAIRRKAYDDAKIMKKLYYMYIMVL